MSPAKTEMACGSLRQSRRSFGDYIREKIKSTNHARYGPNDRSYFFRLRTLSTRTPFTRAPGRFLTLKNELALNCVMVL